MPTPLSPVLRVAIALALWLFSLVELLRFLALAGAPALHGPAFAEHGALALLAGLAGFALWSRARWAPAALLVFGFVFAVARLLDALVLGIRPWLFALFTALAAVILAV